MKWSGWRLKMMRMLFPPIIWDSQFEKTRKAMNNRCCNNDKEARCSKKYCFKTEGFFVFILVGNISASTVNPLASFPSRWTSRKTKEYIFKWGMHLFQAWWLLVFTHCDSAITAAATCCRTVSPQLHRFFLRPLCVITWSPHWSQLKSY